MPSLTDEQKDVCLKIYKNIGRHQVQTLGGYAGTGKTTVIRTLHAKLPRFACCAYTGKAANVMRKKGMSNASTIHSLIYTPIRNLDETVTWELRRPGEIDCDGFFVDEASMVGRDQYLDLMSFGLPIIFIGDHGQLEPVSSKFNLMDNPMYKLEQVHRNAGEIAWFAQHLRQGHIAETFNAEKLVQIVDEKAILDRHLASTSQVICAYNKTRVQINARARKELGFPENEVCVGDRVMCLRNNRRLGLFNGMQGVVSRLYSSKKMMIFEADGIEYPFVHFDPDRFGKESNDSTLRDDDEALPFDWCYGITCHKAQGDEWDNIIVFEQICERWDHVRWAYTAASRGRQGVVWAKAKRKHYQPEWE